MEFFIDRVNRDLAEGWVVAAGGIRTIEVFVDDHLIGTTERRVPRPDVAAGRPHMSQEEANNCGFMIAFPHGSFGRPISKVRLRFVPFGGRSVETQAFSVPDISSKLISQPIESETDGSFPAPFPAEIMRVLRALRGGHYYYGPWDDKLAAEAVSDIEFLVLRGTRHLPAVFSYSIYLKRLWETFKAVLANFPRLANAADPNAKDAVAVLSMIEEMITISHHLFTLNRNGIPGPLLEFGCFKGFSTSLLSHACFDLGIKLHVFDSFAGLPSSESTYYRAGDFLGTIEEVKRNVAEFGRIESVEFHKGFFSETLPAFTVAPACIWMDVDLESSARDVMTILLRLPRKSCVFSHECSPTNFVDGTIQTRTRPEDVVQPIIEAFKRENREVTGQFLFGNTGAFWDRRMSYPVLPTELVLRLVQIRWG
jgi:O-methyltransferase